MPELIRTTALTVAIAAVSVSPWAAAANAPERHQAVRDLQAVGYWPTDEGIGEVLHDRSGHDNHGRIYQVPWRNGLLDFSNDVYQWAQIPYDARYTSPAFTMGGWVFSRRVHKTSRVVFIGQSWLPRLRTGVCHGHVVAADFLGRDFGHPISLLRGLWRASTN